MPMAQQPLVRSERLRQVFYLESMVYCNPMFLAIHHVQLSIPLGASQPARDFYSVFLGLQEIPRANGVTDRAGFWLKLGDQQIHVAEEDFPERGRSRAHVAYEVQDLAGWTSRLISRGIAVSDGRPVPGLNRIDFRDPFGNRIEMVEREVKK